MLFAGGIGTVLMFWGVAEPIFHFSSPPLKDVEPHSVEAAREAIGFSLYHLGLHTWTIFALPGLAFAYFIYRYDLPVRVSSVFYPLLKDKIHGPIGKTIDIFAILGTLFGVAVSIGLGYLADQRRPHRAVRGRRQHALQAGHHRGAHRGRRLLDRRGPRQGREAAVEHQHRHGHGADDLRAGDRLDRVPAPRHHRDDRHLHLQPRAAGLLERHLAEYTTRDGEWGWQGSWTVFYWAWTVTWSPFIGIFVARISRGRTIREFVFGVLFAPSLFTLVWFAIFGWSAMQIDGIGEMARAALGEQAGQMSAAVAESVPLAMFAFFEHFPATQLIQGLAVLIVAIFFATSSDSASLVIDMLCTGDAEPGPVRQRVFWGVSEGAVAAMLIVLAGDAGLAALQQVITVIGLPIFILVFMMVAAMIVGLAAEARETTAPQSRALPAAAKKGRGTS